MSFVKIINKKIKLKKILKIKNKDFKTTLKMEI